jgi:hypothetical protein
MSNKEFNELILYCKNDVVGLGELYFKKQNYYRNISKNDYLALYPHLN